MIDNTTSFLRNYKTGAEIILVGTAHVSKQSAQQVTEVIDVFKPSTVMVELCPARAERLRSGKKNADFLSSFFKPGAKFGQELFKLSMRGFYHYLQSLGLEPGGEFKAAMKAAEKHNARIVYGDRNVQETLQQLAGAVSMQDLLKMLTRGGVSDPPKNMVEFFERSGSFEERVERMKTRVMARQMSDYMRSLNPQFAKALIDDRDAHMFRILSKIEGRVVGVVGLAHLDGIERLWMDHFPGETVHALPG